MPADERIKVIFKSVFVRRDADAIGSSEFFFLARIGGVAVGDSNRIFSVRRGQTINLPEANWSRIVPVRNVASVEVSFQGKDQDTFSDQDLGTVRHILRLPYRQRTFRHQTRFFVLEWRVELAVAGAFGTHPPDTVFSTRQHTGSVTYTTVSGRRGTARLEIHPVRPTPAPPPATVLPARPVFPAGTPAAQENTGNTIVNPGDAINIMPNPSVIPLLGAPTSAPPGPHDNAALDAANWANPRNVAKIEYTYYRPLSLAFADDDPRLEWTAVSVAGGGRVRFFGPPRGTKIQVYGTAAGEVRLECRFQGALFATYRALVQNIRRIPCRFNILNGTTADSTPRATPADVQAHLAICNRFLRQMALELTLDTDPTLRNGARATGIPGIFRINVARGRTRNVNITNSERATLMNYRPNVMNFAYIHSDNSGNLGAATDYPASNAGATITDNGNPSTSWIRPTGVGIGADATPTTTTMNLLTARQRAGHPQLFAMYVTDANGDPAVLAAQQTYAGTIAHEFGHILNLGHRVEGPDATQPTGLVANGIFWDGLTHPPGENVMHWVNPTALAQDFDIIQARAVLQSPLVGAAPALPPAPAPPPPPPPPPPRVNGHSQDYTIVSGDWLSKIAQRHGMTWQELYDYDGGTGTANRARLRSGDPDLIYPGEVIRVPTEA